MDLKTNRKFIIFGAVFTGLLILGVSLALISSSNTKDAGEQTSEKESVPVYQGFDALTKRGVDGKQLESLKYALFQYTEKTHKTVETFSIDPGSIKRPPLGPYTPNRVFTVNFNLKFDNKDMLNAKMEYSNLTTIRLYLYDPDGSSLVYDSKTVDVYDQKRFQNGRVE